ncbi:MAG: hypothetical protein WCV62_06850 [Candidatus Peribacteraceae bacterium]
MHTDDVAQMLDALEGAKDLSSEQSRLVKVLRNREAGASFDPQADVQQLVEEVDALFRNVFCCQ